MVGAVNWRFLAEAVTHFEAAGYKYIEAPWTVPDEITRATCPADRWIVDSSLGNLVGSSEQSFIHLDKIGQLGTGKFVACTPCFRNEDQIDDLHQRTFMKVELYRNDIISPEALRLFVDEVANFYRECPLWHGQHFHVQPFADGSFDIELNGIEIGSYGIRSYLDIHWMYGTALAEPRFSTALQSSKITP